MERRRQLPPGGPVGSPQRGRDEFLFMSVAPRPNSLPSRCTTVNGSLVQLWPSVGTTSVCADSMMPGRSLGPIEAKRLAFCPLESGTTMQANPRSDKKLWAKSMRSRLERVLTVGKLTRRSSSSTVFMNASTPKDREPVTRPRAIIAAAATELTVVTRAGHSALCSQSLVRIANVAAPLTNTQD